MFSYLGDDAAIRKQLEASLGLDKVESGSDSGEEIQPVEQQSEEGHRKRAGVGFKAEKKRVFCAEESKLKEVLKSNKKGLTSKPKPLRKEQTKEEKESSEEEEELSRVEMILKANSNKKEKRDKIKKRRMGAS
ncbi:hypothetical protein BgAZ_403880 [Babesia gibsoni]|uniref:Uncharacterized protein n=1 Tax=Babesia gibsoni TaxID=33632 RepID=A0AAD8LMX6_BABGI|nr:hypothetical protein BgAZ_403880 [Babesia gibsoni]